MLCFMLLGLIVVSVNKFCNNRGVKEEEWKFDFHHFFSCGFLLFSP